jgi:hypothetical protein
MDTNHNDGDTSWSGPKHSTNGGTSFVKSNLFIFALGQALTCGIGLAVFLITYGAEQERDVSLAKRITAQEALTARMDEKGTNFSHYGILMDQARLDKVESQESASGEQIKRIAVMDEKLTRIDKSVDEIKNTMARR